MENNVKKLSQFQEYDWEWLLDSIAQGEVVPVCGAELLSCNVDGKQAPFYEHVLTKMAGKLEIDDAPIQTFTDLYVKAQRKGTQNLSWLMQHFLRDTLKELPQGEQPLLDNLASINDFRIFLTSTPDALLFKSVKEISMNAEELWFSSNFRGKADLPIKQDPGTRYVYHLFGAADSGTDFALTEDDRLEYFYQWMEPDKKPKRLLQELEKKCLLVLGCGYENWETRFFLYGLKSKHLFNLDGSRYSIGRNSLFADTRTPCDSEIDSFLVRSKGSVYCDGDATMFVNELCRRYKDRNPPNQERRDDFAPYSIFISYAHEDKDAAFAIHEQLSKAGLPVWLDKCKLEWGDDFGKEIYRNIDHCGYFMPLYSRHSAHLHKFADRYFLREWARAQDARKARSQNHKFIFPVHIDDCVLSHGGSIPDEWLDTYHHVEAPDGVLKDKDVEELKKSYNLQ